MNKIEQNRILAAREILGRDFETVGELMRIKRELASKYSVGIPSNAEMLSAYREMVASGELAKSLQRENLLRKRAVRTMSGIAPVAVLTKPYGCPGKCAYCPTEKNVPQSYLSNEPAVMRAIRCDYNPSVQIQDRLRALVNNGHEPTKIELIVIGGTWSYFPRKYKYWYIANCFAAANEYEVRGEKYEVGSEKLEVRSKKLEVGSPPFAKGVSDRVGDFGRGHAVELKTKLKYSLSLSVEKLRAALLLEQKKNEKAKYNIIGITLETRPDYIDKKELLEMRELGCTRVELGVQAIDDDILKLNRRGHGVAEIAAATEMLRDFGFKITYHLMPGLPGSSLVRDREMFAQYFSDPRFQPDQIKFYPTVVTRGSLLYRWWKQGRYKPYTDEELQNLIVDCKKQVPPYVRIIRLIRDIPGESIVDGNKITNLRQIMKDRGVACACIRCREVREVDFLKIKERDIVLNILDYAAGHGVERFISFTSPNKKTLYGFCRLYLPSDNIEILPAVLQKSALVRELHVYGQLVSRGDQKKVQHAGLGRKLMDIAEREALKKDFKKITVISGVGVRGYYRKLGYRLQETYMTKSLNNKL